MRNCKEYLATIKAKKLDGASTSCMFIIEKLSYNFAL
jgi:hypothetical protein